jgi:hypothetical protein
MNGLLSLELFELFDFFDADDLAVLICCYGC